ncbi:hypothetical protein Tco_1114565 [Tanacetum coccineum]|uniref:Transposase-associated domain-containing protein n=1 Tax=Tanacetum coccineum TaxID=301880 RepID=A0ABQ5IVF8_9ASTR
MKTNLRSKLHYQHLVSITSTKLKVDQDLHPLTKEVSKTKMDRETWMYNIDRFTPDYVKGLSEFMKCAEAHRKRVRGTLISCPCVRCRNIMSYDNSNTIRHHLIEHGFDTNYTCWNLHGEIPPQVDNDTIVSDFNMDENFGNDDNHRDNLDEMLHDAESNVDEKNVKKLQQLFDDAEKPLFEGCKKFTKLSLVVRLLDLKAKNNWSDRSFTTLLELLHEAFPEDNELPVTTYHAKKLTCPMGLAVERIHACRNDCILYRKDYKDLHECPVCKASRYKHHKNLTELDSDVTKNGPPAKMLWYLPIIPRLKKLYANPKDAKLLRWHAEERKTDGKMRHVADSPQWKNIDRDFKKFGSEIRNIRFGLCSDGINPFKSLSSRHSTWPVLLCIYNLPPWLCMKRKYIMMSLLIQGPKQPGNDIDVYLCPLIDDMIDLWETGVEIYDAYKKERFQLFAMIYCTINDFPAYGNLSGYGTKGEKACPVCENGTHSRWLTNCRKTIYMGHRRALHRHHPYRKKENLFDGTSKDRSMPKLMDGYATLSQVADLNITFGKKVKAPPKRIWKKRSIFWELKYWTHILVRHCLDVMHIEKNVCESLLGLLLNIPGKTKDGVNARKDMLAMGIRSELAPQETNGKKIYLPPACYTLSKAEKTSFCECLHGIKVPSGYSANIKNLVSMKDLKLLGMKSHDCHVLLTQMIPIAIRGLMPPQMYFPPSFFDVMVHLVSHIVEEIKIDGPVFLRVVLFKGRLERVGTIGRKDVTPNTEDLEQVHFIVLQNMTCIEPYIQEHMSYLARKNDRREQRWLEAEHKKMFSQWLADKVIGMSPSNVNADVIQIGYRPRRVLQYQGYDINGYTFYTKKQDDKSTVQNSGVTLIATTTDSSRMEIAKDSYYGVIDEIWELDYTTVVIPILKCKWVDNTRSGVKVDNDGFTCVNLSTNGYLSDPFILAKQVDQVFYVEDPLDKRWHIVLQSKRSIVGVDDVVDEDEYNKFDELPPFSIGFESDAVLSDTIYLRSDHQEGQED